MTADTTALNVTFAIGTSNTQYTFDSGTPLSDVRTRLTADGKLPPDSTTAEYRFVAGQSQSTSFDDAIIAMSVESLVPIQGVLSPGNLLTATNQIATTKADLMGIGTDWLFDRFLGVNISLNTSDPSALAMNKSIGAVDANGTVIAAPFVMTNVTPTSKEVTGIWPNVCVCVENSCVTFTINSWGAVGFSMYIGQDSGTPVVNDDLNQVFGPTPNQYGSAAITRYSSTPQNIQIVGAQTAQIAAGGATVRFQKVTFRTRRMTSYTQNGQTFTSNQMPPPAVGGLTAQVGEGMESFVQLGGGTHLLSLKQDLVNALEVTVVPGGTIKPGGPVAGPPSSDTFGQPISDVVLDDVTQPMGEVVVFFFVFDSLADARLVIDRYNVPDSGLWS